jgi:hypothetical protein
LSAKSLTTHKKEGKYYANSILSSPHLLGEEFELVLILIYLHKLTIKDRFYSAVSSIVPIELNKKYELKSSASRKIRVS